MDEILITLIKSNENILVRRDELIGKLDENVPAKLRRDYAAIRTALELNVGEIFSTKRSNLHEAKRDAEKILHESGMQESRVNFVIETFDKVITAVFSAQIIEETTQTIKTSPTKKVELNKNSVSSETIKPVEKAVEKIFSTAQTIFNKNSSSTSTTSIQDTPPPSSTTKNVESAQISTDEIAKPKNLLIALGVLLVLGFFWHYSFSFGWFIFGLLLGAIGIPCLADNSPRLAMLIFVCSVLLFFFATSLTILSLVCGILAGLVNVVIICATLDD